jgi:hypothetical protein
LSIGLRILEFEPATDGQSIVHAEVLSAFNTLVEFRRRRIEATSYAVPGALWAVVLIGAALAIFASYLFNVDSLLAQSLLTTLLASMIALLVFFIATTDHPYRGVNAMRPRAYEIPLGNLTMAWDSRKPTLSSIENVRVNINPDPTKAPAPYQEFEG